MCNEQTGGESMGENMAGVEIRREGICPGGKNGIICPRGNLTVSLNKTCLIFKLWCLYLLVRINDFSLTKKNNVCG